MIDLNDSIGGFSINTIIVIVAVSSGIGFIIGMVL